MSDKDAKPASEEPSERSEAHALVASSVYKASKRSTVAGQMRFPAIPALYLGRMDTLGFAEGPHQLFRSS